jgi:hypothetical protein
MASDITRDLKGKCDAGAALSGQIVVATIPTLALRFLLLRYVEFIAQSLAVTGFVIIAGVVLLFVFDYLSMIVKRIVHATF